MNFYNFTIRPLKSIIKRVQKRITPNFFLNRNAKNWIEVNGHKLTIPEDLIWAYSRGDYYEENVIRFLDRVVKSYEKPIFIDVGANCGYYSVRYSNSCRQIFSFEPVFTTFEILKKNITENSIKNIVAFKSGLSNCSEEKIINLYNSSGNNSLFARNVPEDHTLKKIGSEVVQLHSLDDLVECGKIPIPNIIKIDVEGSELQVLDGAKKTIEGHRPTIIMEYSENTSNDAGYIRENLLEILELSDYTIYGIPEDEHDFNIVNREDFGRRQIGNLIFLPKENRLIL